MRQSIVNLEGHSALKAVKIHDADAGYIIAEREGGVFVHWNFRESYTEDGHLSFEKSFVTKSKEVIIDKNLSKFVSRGDVFVINPNNRKNVIYPIFEYDTSQNRVNFVNRKTFEEAGLNIDDVIDLRVTKNALVCLLKEGKVLVVYGVNGEYYEREPLASNPNINFAGGAFVYSAPKVKGEFPTKMKVIEGLTSLFNKIGKEYNGDVFLIYGKPDSECKTILSISKSLDDDNYMKVLDTGIDKIIPQDDCFKILKRDAKMSNLFTLNRVSCINGEPISLAREGYFRIPKNEEIQDLTIGTTEVLTTKSGRMFDVIEMRSGKKASPIEIPTNEEVNQAFSFGFSNYGEGIIFITKSGKMGAVIYDYIDMT